MNISEIVSLFAGMCVTMGFVGGIIYTLIKSKLKQDADKLYVSKDHLKSNYITKDDTHSIFVSNGKHDLIMKPLTDKINDILEKLDHIEEKIT